MKYLEELNPGSVRLLKYIELLLVFVIKKKKNFRYKLSLHLKFVLSD